MSINIYDDRPLIHTRFDRLGFKQPADDLAGLLARTTAPEGFVAAVTGEWGEGKSTFLNFVKSSDSLFNTPEDLAPLEVIKFDPWLISGHQNLVTAFFRHLADELRTALDSAKGMAKKGGHFLSKTGIARNKRSTAAQNKFWRD